MLVFDKELFQHNWVNEILVFPVCDTEFGLKFPPLKSVSST